MNCEIIAVGTELLLGDIANTDAQYLSQKLSELGIDVFYHKVVGDNHERLFYSIKESSNRCDLLILTGGLGPTNDDITKEVAAQFLKLPLEFHEESYNRMKSYFKFQKMTDNNKKQAMLPKDSIVLKNDCGTAPGFIYEGKKCIVVVLPGPPKEMKMMFDRSVLPYLLGKTDCVIHSKVLRIFGLGESSAAQKIDDILNNQTNPTIAPYAKENEAIFRITAKAKTKDEAIKLIGPTEKIIRDRLGEYIYGIDDDTIASVLIKILKDNNLKIATAESCTGGLVSSKLTAVPGASEVFETGVVTYSNEAKQRLLGVKAETLEKYGAVSLETAKEMAIGAQEKYNSDIGVSLTGIAGPDGGSVEKPVGLIFIGVSYKDRAEAYKFNFIGDREKIREKSACTAINIAREIILGIR